MLSIDEIKKPIAGDIDVFEGKFKASMQSSVPLLARITHYIVKRKGKQMRPMFLFFSASICGGINDSTHRGAALSYCSPRPFPCSGVVCFFSFLPNQYCKSTHPLLVGYWALIEAETSLDLGTALVTS